MNGGSSLYGIPLLSLLRALAHHTLAVPLAQSFPPSILRLPTPPLDEKNDLDAHLTPTRLPIVLRYSLSPINSSWESTTRWRLRFLTKLPAIETFFLPFSPMGSLQSPHWSPLLDPCLLSADALKPCECSARYLDGATFGNTHRRSHERVDHGEAFPSDTHWFRGNSYFRIGWEWIKTALKNGWTLIRQIRFTRNYDPEPAIASRKQHNNRKYRLEFKVQTYQYVA